MTSVGVRCNYCNKENDKIGYCPNCWKLVCVDCYDEFVGTCKNCAEQIFEMGILVKPDPYENDKTEFPWVSTLAKKSPPISVPSIDEDESEGREDTEYQLKQKKREKDFLLAKTSGHCPKCGLSQKIFELTGGNLYCPKCRSVFTPDIRRLSLPLWGSSAGSSSWDGVIDNIERTLEKDKW